MVKRFPTPHRSTYYVYPSSRFFFIVYILPFRTVVIAVDASTCVLDGFFQSCVSVFSSIALCNFRSVNGDGQRYLSTNRRRTSCFTVTYTKRQELLSGASCFCWTCSPVPSLPPASSACRCDLSGLFFCLPTFILFVSLSAPPHSLCSTVDISFLESSFYR